MTAIQLLACAGMIVGVFLLLGMKPVEFTDSLFGFLLNPKRSLREDIRESSGRKKSGILRRELKEAQNILQMTGRGNRFSIICAVALALFCAGGSIAILLGNFFLAPVMAVGFLGGNAGKFIEEMEIGYDFKDTDEIVDGSKMRLVPCYRIYLLNEDEPFTIYAYTNKAKVNTDMAQPLQGMSVLDESAVQ